MGQLGVESIRGGGGERSVCPFPKSAPDHLGNCLSIFSCNFQAIRNSVTVFEVTYNTLKFGLKLDEASLSFICSMIMSLRLSI